MDDPGDLVLRDELVEDAGLGQVGGDVDQPVEELGGDDARDPQRSRSDVGGDDGNPDSSRCARPRSRCTLRCR